ncbi:MAG: GNAT family N-acetyltransferase [Streptosporangiaceae bacterium]
MNRTQSDQGPAREAATIRPPDTADLAALGGFFAGLSMRSRVQRFFAPIQPSPAMIRLACGFGGSGVSGHDRRPSRTGGTDALVATLGGVIIGHAMAVERPAGRTAPPEGRVTEIGVVVADAWQGQGVGSALVRALTSRARARGVTSLSMDVLPANRQVLAMIASHWTASRTHRATDYVTIQTPLPEAAHARSSRVRRRPSTSATVRATTTPGRENARVAEMIPVTRTG